MRVHSSLALCPYLHPRHDIAVDELARPEGDDRRQDDARNLAEHRFIRRLSVPSVGRRQADDHPAHERHEQQRAEPCPDDAARAGISVDLGQHVADDIAQREEQNSRAIHPLLAADGDERRLGRADDVGQQQHGDERRHDEIIVAEAVRRGVEGGHAGWRTRNVILWRWLHRRTAYRGLHSDAKPANARCHHTARALSSAG